MDTLYEINQNEFIEELAISLKSKIKMPEWAKFVKSGVNAERPPVNADWWYIRSAAILRTVYLKGPIGTAKLRTKYGGKKNKGVAPERVYKAGGKIIRTILQDLEKSKLIRFKDAGVNKGRVTSKEGADFIKNVADSVKKKASKKE